MAQLRILLAVVLLSLNLTSAMAQNTDVKDYLSIPGPIDFGGTSFNLAWSSNPSQGYYKHEYVPSGETVERFKEMIIIEVVQGSLSLRDALNAKVKELNARKEKDPYLNYDIIENPNTGEFILDFIVSDSNGGEAGIVEWNAYRYVDLKSKSGKEGVMLFALSRRSYGEEISPFLKILKDNRPNGISMLSSYTVPDVRFSE